MKQIVGIFEGINSLYALLDDRLIYLRNSENNNEVNLIFDSIMGKKQSINFLSANNYDVKEKSNHQLKMAFPKSNNDLNNLNLIFVNTSFNENKIWGIVNDFKNKRDKTVQNLIVYLLNSNSYFGYYNQLKDIENTSFIGSPTFPTKMDNKNKRPF